MDYKEFLRSLPVQSKLCYLDFGSYSPENIAQITNQATNLGTGLQNAYNSASNFFGDVGNSINQGVQQIIGVAGPSPSDQAVAANQLAYQQQQAQNALMQQAQATEYGPSYYNSFFNNNQNAPAQGQQASQVQAPSLNLGGLNLNFSTGALFKPTQNGGFTTPWNPTGVVAGFATPWNPTAIVDNSWQKPISDLGSNLGQGIQQVGKVGQDLGNSFISGINNTFNPPVNNGGSQVPGPMILQGPPDTIQAGVTQFLGNASKDLSTGWNSVFGSKGALSQVAPTFNNIGQNIGNFFAPTFQAMSQSEGKILGPGISTDRSYSISNPKSALMEAGLTIAGPAIAIAGTVPGVSLGGVGLAGASLVGTKALKTGANPFGPLGSVNPTGSFRTLSEPQAGIVQGGNFFSNIWKSFGQAANSGALVVAPGGQPEPGQLNSTYILRNGDVNGASALQRGYLGALATVPLTLGGASLLSLIPKAAPVAEAAVAGSEAAVSSLPGWASTALTSLGKGAIGYGNYILGRNAADLAIIPATAAIGSTPWAQAQIDQRNASDIASANKVWESTTQKALEDYKSSLESQRTPYISSALMNYDKQTGNVTHDPSSLDRQAYAVEVGKYFDSLVSQKLASTKPALTLNGKTYNTESDFSKAYLTLNGKGPTPMSQEPGFIGNWGKGIEAIWNPVTNAINGTVGQIPLLGPLVSGFYNWSVPYSEMSKDYGKYGPIALTENIAGVGPTFGQTAIRWNDSSTLEKVGGIAGGIAPIILPGLFELGGSLLGKGASAIFSKLPTSLQNIGTGLAESKLGQAAAWGFNMTGKIAASPYTVPEGWGKGLLTELGPQGGTGFRTVSIPVESQGMFIKPSIIPTDLGSSFTNLGQGVVDFPLRTSVNPLSGKMGVNVWGGLSLFNKPLIGRSGGDWVFGSGEGSLNVPSRAFLAESAAGGYRPISKLETNLLFNRPTMTKLGITPNEFSALQDSLSARTQITASNFKPNLPEVVPLQGTKTLSKESVQFIYNELKNSGKDWSAFGSLANDPQLAPLFQGGKLRPLTDADIMSSGDQEWINSFVKKIIPDLTKVERLSDPTATFKIDPENPGHIVKQVGPKNFASAVDMHSLQGTGIAYPSETVSYGLKYASGNQKNITMNLEGVGQVRAMPITEHGTILIHASSGIYPDRIGPSSWRMKKDPLSAYGDIYTILGPQRGLAWMKTQTGAGNFPIDEFLAMAGRTGVDAGFIFKGTTPGENFRGIFSGLSEMPSSPLVSSWMREFQGPNPVSTNSPFIPRNGSVGQVGVPVASIGGSVQASVPQIVPNSPFITRPSIRTTSPFVSPTSPFITKPSFINPISGSTYSSISNSVSSIASNSSNSSEGPSKSLIQPSPEVPSPIKSPFIASTGTGSLATLRPSISSSPSVIPSSGGYQYPPYNPSYGYRPSPGGGEGGGLPLVPPGGLGGEGGVSGGSHPTVLGPKGIWKVLGMAVYAPNPLPWGKKTVGGWIGKKDITYGAKVPRQPVIKNTKQTSGTALYSNSALHKAVTSI